MLSAFQHKQAEPAAAALAPDVAIAVRGVSKKFCPNITRSMIYGMRDLAANIVGLRNDTLRLRKEEFWALKDVSFTLKRGEGMGLVGPNGSGKTTLLRLISGIYPMDEGDIAVRGRIGALIALGAGFHPLLTGRENVYLNGTILGLSRREIDEKFESITNFAEIPRFLDAPVSTYSSGMRARLGFAVAVHLNPDILLIDEVLAVGDLRFRGKCYRMLEELRDKGTSFIMVSHNPLSIQQLCEHSVYLKRGQVEMIGSSADVVSAYENDQALGGPATSVDEVDFTSAKATADSGLTLSRIAFTDAAGAVLPRLRCGEPATLRLACRLERPLQQVGAVLVIRDVRAPSAKTLSFSTRLDDVTYDLPAGEREIRVHMPYLGLAPGNYVMKAFVIQGRFRYLAGVESHPFSVEGGTSMSGSSFFQPHAWSAAPAGATL